VKFGVVPVPRDKAFGAFNAVEVLSVNKDSKLKDAAWDFIRILQDQAIVNNVLESSGWVPLRRPGAAQILPRASRNSATRSSATTCSGC
jgi:ABC-type glycerol-3-phosphate transport system substrate-binding protein